MDMVELFIFYYTKNKARIQKFEPYLQVFEDILLYDIK